MRERERESKSIQDAAKEAHHAAGREMANLKTAGNRLMRKNDELSAHVDNLEKLNNILKAESLESNRKITALKAQLDEQTKSAVYHTEGSDAAKRLAAGVEESCPRVCRVEEEDQRSRREDG